MPELIGLLNTPLKVSDISLELSDYTDHESLPKYIPHFEPILSVDAEVNFDMSINYELFSKLTSVDLAYGSDRTVVNIIVESPKFIKVRRHKKKRIDKKWNKKYGEKYITVFKSCQLRDVTIEPHDDYLDIMTENVILH